MSVFKNILGVMSSTFRIGGPTGPNVKNNSGVLELRNTADNDYVKGRALRIQTSNGINDIAVLVDAMDKVIQFSFDGATPPNAGDNTGKFGFCHTTGGSYTAADIVYDTGSALLVMPRETCKVIYTTDAVSGTVSLNADGVYGWEGSAYVLKGDGAATDTGFVKCIEVAYTKDSTTVDSTTSLPNGSRVTRVVNRVDTVFNGTAPTLLVQANGSSPVSLMATGDSNLKLANQYDNEDIVDIGATGTGVVRLTVTADSSTTGAGKVLVFYVTPGA